MTYITTRIPLDAFEFDPYGVKPEWWLAMVVTGKAENAGKLPVIKANGTTASKDKFGTNYKPNLSIEKWVTRPTEFDNAPANDEVAEAPKAAASASEF